MLKLNVANWDRWARIIGGLFLASLAFWGPHSLWGLIGLIFVATGIAGFCPIYRLLKTGTLRERKDTKKCCCCGD